MKRIGYIFEKICSVENLQISLSRACRGKKKTRAIREVLENRDALIADLHATLINGRYKPGANKIITTKATKAQKARTIEIPPFWPDRVVHWAICLQLNKIFMRGMYAYCIGSIPRRGGEFGRRYIVKIFKNDGKIRYAAQTDLRKFFQNISKPKLKGLFRRKIKDKKALALIDMVIDAGVQGLPIGFYTSQWFSNFYLEQLDHAIKEALHARYYVRNVDDMVYIDTNKRKLHRMLKAITAFLSDGGFNVCFKDNWQVYRLDSRPINFIGYKFSHGKLYVRHGIYFNLMRKLNKVKRRGYCTVKAARGIASLLGWFKHLPHGRHFYLTYVKPIISKRQLSKIISNADRRNKELKNDSQRRNERQNRKIQNYA